MLIQPWIGYNAGFPTPKMDIWIRLTRRGQPNLRNTQNSKFRYLRWRARHKNAATLKIANIIPQITRSQFFKNNLFFVSFVGFYSFQTTIITSPSKHITGLSVRETLHFSEQLWGFHPANHTNKEETRAGVLLVGRGVKCFQS